MPLGGSTDRIIDTTRCLPGLSRMGAGAGTAAAGRATAAGAETSVTRPPSVPFWLARTG
jgi:hypothetical protein